MADIVHQIQNTLGQTLASAIVDGGAEVVCMFAARETKNIADNEIGPTMRKQINSGRLLIIGSSTGIPTADKDYLNDCGTIATAAGFPAEPSNGDLYRVTADVTDSDATKTATGQSFAAGDEIYWKDTAWVLVGPDSVGGGTANLVTFYMNTAGAAPTLADGQGSLSWNAIDGILTYTPPEGKMGVVVGFIGAEGLDSPAFPKTLTNLVFGSGETRFVEYSVPEVGDITTLIKGSALPTKFIITLSLETNPL